MIAAMEAGNFTERELKRIWRANERIRLERGLPPPPPSKVTNLDALKALPTCPISRLKKSRENERTPMGQAAPPDPNKAQNAPISAPVEPKIRPKPWRVVGMGRSNFGGGAGGFTPWGQ